MYRYSPQTLHLFSSQITQTCHTIALLGPAKKAHQILLCWIYASFIPSLKKRNWSLWKHLPDSRNSKVTISPPYPNHQEDNRFERCWNQNPPQKKTDLRCENSFRAPLLQIHHRQRHQPTAVSSWTEDQEDQNHLRTLSRSLHASIFLLMGLHQLIKMDEFMMFMNRWYYGFSPSWNGIKYLEGIPNSKKTPINLVTKFLFLVSVGYQCVLDTRMEASFNQGEKKRGITV